MIEIVSPLTVSEVVARLRQQVGEDVPFLNMARSHPTRPLSGWVSETEFAIRVRTSGNAFSTVRRGTVESTPTGSVVRIRLQSQRPLGPFVRAAAGFVTLGAIFVLALGNPLTAPLAGIVLGAVVFTALVRTLTQREEQTLLGHLHGAAQVKDH